MIFESLKLSARPAISRYVWLGMILPNRGIDRHDGCVCAFSLGEATSLGDTATLGNSPRLAPLQLRGLGPVYHTKDHIRVRKEDCIRV